MITYQTDEWLSDYIKLRKARAEGNDIEFGGSDWLLAFLREVNIVIGNTNVRFGNIQFHDWMYLSMEALLPENPRQARVARLEARFDGEYPAYRLYFFDRKGKTVSEFAFLEIANPMHGLGSCLKEICGDNLKVGNPG